MPVHDWTRVDAGIFHDFHNVWVVVLRNALNRGLLPSGYYALSEQHAGKYIADVLTLHTDSATREPTAPLITDDGGVAVAVAPPKVRRELSITPGARSLRKTLAIRHISGHRLIAIVEMVSAANKDRGENVADFAAKVGDALRHGVHVLLIDLLPPGRYDPQGMHAAVARHLDELVDPYDLPADEPLTLASYVARTPVKVYLEHRAVGDTLPEMPLFLTVDRYVPIPLDSTYQTAWADMPAFWRDVLESG